MLLAWLERRLAGCGEGTKCIDVLCQGIKTRNPNPGLCTRAAALGCAGAGVGRKLEGFKGGGTVEFQVTQNPKP